MFTKFQKSFQTGVVTSRYPKEKEPAPLRFRGRIEIDHEKCRHCNACVEVCPTNAYTWVEEKGKRYLQMSHAKCIFCGMCEEACPFKAVTITNDFELTTKNKDNLLVKAGLDETASVEDLGTKLKEEIFSVFRRSLHVREVDAGSCNGCEWEVAALYNSPVHDLQRFGIDIVASPRHADCLLVTGPPTRNLEAALIKTYHSTPDPKMVIALGACACSGGIFSNCYATKNGIDNVVPVDVYIPGCPPRPQAIIYGFLLALKRIKK
ncbi:hydrogenase [Candidatus Brocadia sapporoensis]|uniref:Hydrogenase n=1 Tax=Candidatus Brocadia sapporoensis TaxID=392547 RepID=A0A1V6LWY8_9BACT|nr:NADH-quinone oxidoreductase subunit NuoB [Candidatus Brocadia sapporoensis]MDG6006182.1 NADH-quinone oxidoreductase subunit NuoB [Candidatus Brocadia sp.]OQD44653.1 hydrogenase [Candidatus Brocadia sapporoensis]GJQ22245.1 MAG: hydrogenase [Candidatus Brocadia sapporoensis]